MDDLQNNTNTNTTVTPESQNTINSESSAQIGSSIINPISVNNNDMNSPASEDNTGNTDNSQLNNSPDFDNGLSSGGSTSSPSSDPVPSSVGSLDNQNTNVNDPFNVAENTTGSSQNSTFDNNAKEESNPVYKFQSDSPKESNNGGELPPINDSKVVDQPSTTFNVGENNTVSDSVSPSSNSNDSLGSSVIQNASSDTAVPTQPVSVSNDPDVNKPKIVAMAIVVGFLLLIGLLILYFSIFK